MVVAHEGVTANLLDNNRVVTLTQTHLGKSMICRIQQVHIISELTVELHKSLQDTPKSTSLCELG